MAAIAMMVGGAITNALAFSGSNFIFSRIERQRHNAAMEKLQRDRDEWNKQRISKIDYINQKLKDQGHAERTFRSVDEALQNYYFLTGGNLTDDDELAAWADFPPEPQLSDYLDENTASALQNGELTLIAVGLLITGYLTYKFV